MDLKLHLTKEVLIGSKPRKTCLIFSNILIHLLLKKQIPVADQDN